MKMIQKTKIPETKCDENDHFETLNMTIFFFHDDFHYKTFNCDCHMYIGLNPGGIVTTFHFIVTNTWA